MPKRRKTPRAVQNSISGRGTALEYNLVSMDPNGPQCGKNSLPLNSATKCTAAERPPESLLRVHHEMADSRRLPHSLRDRQRTSVGNPPQPQRTVGIPLEHLGPCAATWTLSSGADVTKAKQTLYLQREAPLPHHTTPLQDERIFRIFLVSKLSVCGPGGEARAVPYPRVLYSL